MSNLGLMDGTQAGRQPSTRTAVTTRDNVISATIDYLPWRWGSAPHVFFEIGTAGGQISRLGVPPVRGTGITFRNAAASGTVTFPNNPSASPSASFVNQPLGADLLLGPGESVTYRYIEAAKTSAGKVGWWAMTDLNVATAFARSLLDDADAGTARATLGAATYTSVFALS